MGASVFLFFFPFFWPHIAGQALVCVSAVLFFFPRFFGSRANVSSRLIGGPQSRKAGGRSATSTAAHAYKYRCVWLVLLLNTRLSHALLLLLFFFFNLTDLSLLYKCVSLHRMRKSSHRTGICRRLCSCCATVYVSCRA